LQNRGKAAHKEDLAQWVSLALKRALTILNITKEFRGTGIWLLNPHAIDGRMGPSLQFRRCEKELKRSSLEFQTSTATNGKMVSTTSQVSSLRTLKTKRRAMDKFSGMATVKGSRLSRMSICKCY
jgi:hypothetical protein